MIAVGNMFYFYVSIPNSIGKHANCGIERLTRRMDVLVAVGAPRTFNR